MCKDVISMRKLTVIYHRIDVVLNSLGNVSIFLFLLLCVPVNFLLAVIGLNIFSVICWYIPWYIFLYKALDCNFPCLWNVCSEDKATD